MIGRRNFLAAATGLVATTVVGCRAPSAGPAGQSPVSERLPPFVPGRRSVDSTGLPRRLAFANTTDLGIFAALGRGYQQAASDRGLEYVTANAQGDDMRNITQISNFLSAGVGGMLIQPLNKTAQAPALRGALGRGIHVQGIITDPCTLQIVTMHYKTGKRLGTAAAQYIQEHLDGRAQVCNFNQDSLSLGLRQRHQGILDGLSTGGPGVRVVADVATPGATTIAVGYSLMLELLEQHPDINVVVGQDSIAVGAYRAMQSVGKLREDMYFAGTDGEATAFDLVRAGTPYRASYAFGWQLMGYTLGNLAADWIDGLETPRALHVLNQAMTDAAKVDAFEEANRNPAKVIADPAALSSYMALLGNVGYANRDVVWEGAYEP